MKSKCIGGIDCRSVGPGGTSVCFYPTQEGVKCIWENENCPYDFGGVKIDRDTREASDGHNVSVISWEVIDQMMQHRPKRVPVPNGIGLNPQPKKQINKKKGH